MKFKKTKKTKTDSIRLRVSKDQKNRLQVKANLYTDGNLSEYLIYCGLNFRAKPSDFEK